MGLYCTISEETAISVENHFFLPRLVTPPPKGSLVIGYRRVYGQEARSIALPERERSLTISSAVWIQYTNVTDGRTDRQTDRRTDGHQLAAKTALRIASRGKMYVYD